MNKYLERAIELKTKTIEDRRHIHQNPECGMVLPNTKEYVNHSPNVLFNEDCMPYGAAGFVTCAVNWLKNNR